MSPPSHQSLAWLVADRYLKGDHLVDGGPEVGLFWASNISALGTHAVRPISEGLSILSNAMKDPVYSKGLRDNLSQYF